MNDSSEFEEFVRRHQDMVYGIAVRLLADPSEAEDVSQSVFLKAYERFGSLAGNPAAPGWLRTVARNTCLNHLTRHRMRWRPLRRAPRHESRAQSAVEEALAIAGSQADDLVRREEQARLERGIRGLPRHQRVPIVLFHFEELSYKDIAASMGVSVSKVKTDLHRGRAALRELLVAHDDA